MTIDRRLSLLARGPGGGGRSAVSRRPRRIGTWLQWVGVWMLAMTLPWATVRAAPAASDAAQSSSPADEPGDWGAEAAAAEQARETSPTPDDWRAEAQAKERLGDYVGAQAAYEGELAALPEDAVDARRHSRADWERVREAARGRDAQEPASTHRAELDRAWAPPGPRKSPSPRARKAVEPAEKDRDDRIVTKWYFWVTVAAIAASAAAVTGIAIKAARDERQDALDASVLQPTMRGPALIRF